MYILDARRLRDDLIRNRVSETDFAIYAFLAAGVSVPIWVPPQVELRSFPGAIEYGAAIAHIAVAALGTRACYIANGCSNSRDFLNRFISLAWVVGARLVLLLAIPVMLLLLMLSRLHLSVVEDAMLELTLLGASAFYYWRLSLQISLVHHAVAPAA